MTKSNQLAKTFIINVPLVEYIRDKDYEIEPKLVFKQNTPEFKEAIEYLQTKVFTQTPLDQEYLSEDQLIISVDMETGELLPLHSNHKVDLKSITQSRLFMKTVDMNNYAVLDENNNLMKSAIIFYSPEFIGDCQEWGDYINFDIENGFVTNWGIDQEALENFLAGKEE